MNPNDNKNNKNNKPGGNWRGVASLVGWALLLTIIFSYASSVIGSTGRQASSINVEYGEFQEMVESGQVARVEFDNAEDILLITPEEGYSYTAEDGTVYTKTEDGYTYMDAAGQEQTAHLELFTVRIQSNDAVIDFLNEYGVEGVDKEYQAPVNPVLAMLVSYVLPFVLIFLMFSLVMRWMAKKGRHGRNGRHRRRGQGQRQGVYGEVHRRHLQGCGRPGRGQGVPDRDHRLPAQPPEVHGDRREAPQGRAAGRPSGHRQDAAGQGRGRRGQRPVFLHLRLRLRGDVRGRGRQPRPGPL